MPKFNPKQIQTYLQTLQTVLGDTQEAANQVSPYFVKLDEARQADKLGDLPKAEFAEIKAEFDDAVGVYQKNATILADAKPPVRWLGVHKLLVKNYADYAKATEAMADAVVLDGQKIKEAEFSQSEKDQETSMNKVQANVGKIFGGL
ncbi:chemotaxis protein [Leuconostocaceae bacterium ESL0723]|nr:chemotaxis protein [Lactobacillaceae bacterium L1_55_11]WEV54204.1 chemotaxis protein [Leuconostocaceae bacterium ESL0723]